jgi:hypothetical protein
MRIEKLKNLFGSFEIGVLDLFGIWYLPVGRGIEISEPNSNTCSQLEVRRTRRKADDPF